MLMDRGESQCDWCYDPAAYKVERRTGSFIYLYACPQHKTTAERFAEEFNKKKIGKVKK